MRGGSSYDWDGEALNVMSSSKEAKDVSIQRCAGTRRICKRGISGTPLSSPSSDRSVLGGHSWAPETHYAKSGDVNIAYQVIGSGSLDLVLVPGWVSHVEQAWEEPSFAGFLHRIGIVRASDLPGPEGDGPLRPGGWPVDDGGADG